MKKEGHKPVLKTFLSVGSVIILVLAAISFIVIPAMLPGSQRQLPPVGSYRGTKIEYTTGSYFANAVDYYDREEREQLKKQNKSSNGGFSFNTFNQAFRDAVMMAAFTDEVKRSGYVAPASLVERSMLMLRYFQNENGEYSAKIYRDTPDSRKIEIQNETEKQLIFNRYSEDIAGIKVSDAEVQFVLNMNYPSRSFDAAFFSTSDYPKEEAAAFGKNHAELFKKYDLSVITTATEAEAKKVANRLQHNELVFSDAVSEYSTKQYSDENGVLNGRYHYQLKNIIKAEDKFKEITELAPGSISGAVETTTGWSVFTCTGASENADFSDQSVVDTVYNYMTVYEAGTIEEYFINIAKDFSAQAAVKDFYEAAEAFNAQTATVPAFPINYGNTQLLNSIQFRLVPQLTGAQSNEKFLTTAFSLSEKEISEPLVVERNIVVLRLKNVETEDTEADVMRMFYSQYYNNYAAQSNARAVQSFFMASPHLKNNMLNVFFKYFMAS
ncbi:peptidylprolyl isomerase [Treponema maltophilum]|uniref:peptidylprolyl isomerase n=1 Tax=Treponema maltophilum TaxID=51160 RepID=UPI003D90D63F